MFRISKKVEYALIALIDLANAKMVEPVTAKSLAHTYNLPQELLCKVMQKLTKQNILHSVQGVKGGYSLYVDPKDVSLKQVIEVLEGPISIIACNHNDGEKCSCDVQGNCTIKSPLEIIQMELIEYFENISIDDLRKKQRSTISAPIQIGV